MKFDFHYSADDDVLSIYNYNLQPSESIEFSEYLNIDINKEGNVVGLEIIDASQFFSMLNKKINKSFLSDLDEVQLEEKEFRNNWFIAISFKSQNQIISQVLPPIRKSEYASPLLAQA